MTARQVLNKITLSGIVSEDGETVTVTRAQWADLAGAIASDECVFRQDCTACSQ